MAIEDCGHCGSIQGQVNEICEKNGWQVNHLVLIFDAEHPEGCNCTCSCLAFGTPVQDGNGNYQAIEEYQVGETVMASGLLLNWKPHRVEFSNGTPGIALQRNAVLVVYEDTAIAVTSDHLFLMEDRKLKRADRLVAGDNLLDPQGKSIPIKSVHIGNMHAGFHHIATKAEKPGPDLDGHLLNTNGVISADYAVQLHYRSPHQRAKSLATSFVERHEELPIVGSPEYVAQYGDDCLRTPELPEERGFLQLANTHGYLELSTSNRNDHESSTFIPAEATRIAVPEYAHSFIPPDYAKEREALPDKRPFNDPQSRGWTEWLLEYHGYFYPDVEPSLDWASTEVNAYAWIDKGTGQRRIDIKGGLVRDNALELEGIAVVIAHELAHHYGGEPTGGHPDKLSCEGQADYEAVASIMRKVWFGEQYIQTVDRGIEQMADFFGVPDSSTAPGGSAGCAHPAGACRIATYYAGAALLDKPGCAE